MNCTIQDILKRTVIVDDSEHGRVCDVLFDDSTWALRYLVLCPDTEDDDRELLLPLHYLNETGPAAPDPSIQGSSIRGLSALKPLDYDPPVSRQHLLMQTAKRTLIPYYDYAQNWGAISISMITQWSCANLCAAVERDNKQKSSKFDPHLRSGREVIGYGVQASDGRAGRVIDFILDETQQVIKSAIVEISRFWRRARLRLPVRYIEGIYWDTMRVAVGIERRVLCALIRNVPPNNSHVHLSA